MITERYFPKDLSEIIGNKVPISKILNWLKNFPKEKKSNLILDGNHGLGKSLTIQLILKQLDFQYNIIHSSEIKKYRSSGELSQIQNFSNNLGVTLLDKSKNFCLVIENIEMISLPSEKSYLLNNLKFNHKKKYFPIILINNGQHSKILNEMKKLVLEISFFQPSVFDLKPFIKNIIKKENIKIDPKYLIGIVKYCRNDVRKILLTLQDLKDSFSNNEISKEKLKEFFENNNQKSEEIGLYSSAEKIIYSYKNMESIIDLYQLEKILLPLNIHENLGHKINYIDIENQEKIDLISKIEDKISYGELIETSIYTDQNWYLKNLHTFYSCIYPSFHLNKEDFKVLKHEPSINFTNDLSTTSLKKINNKNFKLIKQLFPNFNSNDIFQLSYICYELLKNAVNTNNITEIKKFLSDLPIKITQKEFEVIIKINKLDFDSKEIDKKLIKSIF